MSDLTARRDADIVDALRDGPLTARDITVKLFGTPEGSAKPRRSYVARVTQSLRFMERDCIVRRRALTRDKTWLWELTTGGNHARNSG